MRTQLKMDLKKQTVINPLTTKSSWTRQAIYAQRNNVALSRRNVCNGNSTNTISVHCRAICHYQKYKNIKCCTTILLWRIYVVVNNTSYSGPRLKWPIFSRQIFRKVPNIKLHGNPSSGSDGRTWRSQEALFNDFANESKIPLNKLGYDNIERTYIVLRNGMEVEERLRDHRHVCLTREHSEIGIPLNYGYAFCSLTQSSVSKHLA